MMRQRQDFFLRWLAVGAVAAMVMPVGAQTNRGSLSGSVLDASGAVIPGAEVTATNNENGAVYKTTATGSGGFQIQQMSLGSYTVSVGAPGFSTSTQNGVLIQVAQVTALDVKLAAGQAADTVTVDASGETLQTESSDIGTVIDARQVIDLPLSLGGQKGARAPEAFVFLTPGTVAYGSGNGAAGPSFFSKTSGGQNFGTEVILDGASTFRSENGSTFDETSPSVESIGEFKVLTSTLPAEYGRTTGGIEVFATHQGANTFHGTAFEIYRNEALNANSLFNNIDRIAQPNNPAFRRTKDRQNDYGGSFNGPVAIPHVYNGRDKTFFFFDFEAYRQNFGATNTNTVPTSAVRAGDFSAYLGAPLTQTDPTTKITTPVINPCTGQQVLANQIFDPATEKTVGGVVCRSPFPNNMIDPARFSTVAKNVLGYVPAATNTSLFNNYALGSSSPNANTMMTVRVDQNLGQRDKLYFSFSVRENTPNINPDFAGPVSTVSSQDFTTHYYRAGYDHTFTPTLLNHLNLGYNRTNSINLGAGVALGIPFAAKLGIGNVLGNTFPNFAFNDGNTTSIHNIGQAGNNDTIDNGYRVNDSVTKSLGKQTLTIGGDGRYQKFYPLSHNNESGSFNFSTNQTAFAPTYQGQTGSGFASFLLGQVDGGNLANYSAGQANWIYSYGAVFAQDDFKLTPTLTLNLGVRYDVDDPRRERGGNTSNFSPTTPNPSAGGLPGALVFGGTGTGRNGNKNERWADTWYKDVAPRIGFAWAPRYYDGKTVIRGGFGTYYGAIEYADFGGSLRDGFAANPQRNSPNAYDAAFNIDNGFPTYAAPPNLDPGQDNGGGINYIKRSNGRPATVYNWSMQVEQQLATDLILDIGYVGQHSTYLHSSFSGTNNIPVSAFALGDRLGKAVSTLTGVALPFPTFDPVHNNFAQTLRPFPQYQRINTDCCLENEGVSSFNALEVQLKRRYRNGLNLLVSYTFSKTLTDADSQLPFFATIATSPGSPQNPENKKGEKSISTQDLPSNLVFSYLYELPIGNGKKYLSGNKLVSSVVGGISLGGVQRYESGQPYAFGQSGTTGVPGFDENIRFNRVPGQPIYSQAYYRGHFDPRHTSIFNNAAFDNPNSDANRAARGGAFGFGNLPRVTSEVRTHTYLDEDFSFIKRTRIHERFGLDLKVNFLNAFNRKILNRANANGPADGGFGQTGSTILGPRQIQPELRLEF